MVLALTRNAQIHLYFSENIATISLNLHLIFETIVWSLYSWASSLYWRTYCFEQVSWALPLLQGKAGGMHSDSKRIHLHDCGRENKIHQYDQDRLHWLKVQGRVWPSDNQSQKSVSKWYSRTSQLPSLAPLVHLAVRKPTAQNRLHGDRGLLGLELSLWHCVAWAATRRLVHWKQRLWREWRDTMRSDRAFQRGSVETGAVCGFCVFGSTI